MRKKITFPKPIIVASIFSLLLIIYISSARPVSADDTNGFQLSIRENGKVHLPDVDFQRDWTALGTWAIAADEGTVGAEGFHTVYTQPKSVTAFRKTGEFPDGTILIKELYEAITNEMTTGTVSRASKITGWFVMVKDLNNRYPDNQSWGDGWAWAQFDSSDRKNSISTNYKDDCLSCHEPVKNSDWVYVEGYPILRND